MFDDATTPWPYLVTTWTSGEHWEQADLCHREKSAIARDLGRQVHHYELAQIQLNLFDGDKVLLRTFLDHSEWPVERDFARRALAQAFRRQAVGLAQHGRWMCSTDCRGCCRLKISRPWMSWP